ncbi:TPA: hypothetical protein ACGSMF_004794 [Bacillus cereus]|uniref:hypothetical protein n=1 Tax=Bacillus cereus TaxID=1396 RepID=UPI002AC14DF5|nr:hypothetical protein [Bacillus cereus]MCU5743618.1 hypothetical protein [Bacillus cereus]MCU9578317.1 hypothetical protein [Bacillus cereus]MDA1785014.1 hypothetical protein [Bacillus cereus]MDZ4537017.1 hypothetical protein [Bacillus cereus]
MRILIIIALVVIGLVFSNVISIHTIETVADIIRIIITIVLGDYFLYRFALRILALFTTFIGVILVICLITYAVTKLL